MSCTVYQHPRSPVVFDPPLPAAVRAQSTSPILELRAQCAAAVADYRRGASLSPGEADDLALALTRLMDAYGDRNVSEFAWALDTNRRINGTAVR